MKFLSGILALLLFTTLPSPTAGQQRTVQSVHREGVALYNAGKFEEALEKFNLVLQYQPSYVYARVYANKCRLAIKQNQGPTNKGMEQALARVILPSVDFQEVPLSDVLTYVRQRTEELTGGEVSPNLIFSGTAEQRDSAIITMKLRNIPVTVLLKYVADQARCQLRYDPHAIMITPYRNIPEPAATTTNEPNPFGTAAPNPFE